MVSGIPGVLDVKVDPVGGKLYWTSQYEIQRSNLDGTGIEDLVTLSGQRFEKSIVLVQSGVPEPSTLILAASGSIVGLACTLRRLDSCPTLRRRTSGWPSRSAA